MASRGISDSEKFAGLIRDHAGIVRKIAATYARDPDDRADLVQDIPANLWAAWPRYDDTRPFPTWMYRVVLNVALSHVRSVYREQRVMTPLTVDHDAVAATGPDGVAGTCHISTVSVVVLAVLANAPMLHVTGHAE